VRKIYSLFTFLFTIFIFQFFVRFAQAQVQIIPNTEIGETNVSDGEYIRLSLLGSYQIGRNRIEAGSSFNLMSASSNFSAGYAIKLSRELQIKDFPVELQGLFLYLPFSDLIHETDWGLLSSIKPGHFNLQLGTSFRRYRITQLARANYEILSNETLNENWNIIYLFGYQLKPADHIWNAGITITNMDNFLINQETNPMLSLHGEYGISEALTVYTELWYKNSGVLNISANQFGYLFRTGIIWELKTGPHQ